MDLAAQQRRIYLEQYWKLGLRAVATAISISAVGVAAYLVTIWANDDDSGELGVGAHYDDYEYYATDCGAWIGMGFCIVAIMWNGAEFITLAVRKLRKGGIHPGAHVALDLILWLGLLSAGIVEIALDFWVAASISLCTLLFLNAILHFVLFVWACVDTNRRNKKPKDKVVQLAIQMVEAQQQQARSTLPPDYEKPYAPQNVIMVPVDEWELMQVQLSQYKQMSSYEGAVSPLGERPLSFISRPAPAKK